MSTPNLAVIISVLSVLLVRSATFASQRPPSGVQQTLETDQRVTNFRGHEFLCSFEVAENQEGDSSIRYDQTVTNQSGLIAEQIRWHSAGMIVNRLEGQERASSDWELLHFGKKPIEFDSFRDEGIPSLEIDLSRGSSVVTDRKNEAPCLLPRLSVWKTRLDSLGPFRVLEPGLEKILSRGLQSVGRFRKGGNVTTFSSRVIRDESSGMLQYIYTVESTRPVSFRWVSVSSLLDGELPNGLKASASPDRGAKEEYVSKEQPILVIDFIVFADSEKDLDLLKLPNLAGSNDYSQRMLGFFLFSRDYPGGLMFDSERFGRVEMVLAPAFIPSNLRFSRKPGVS